MTGLLAPATDPGGALAARARAHGVAAVVHTRCGDGAATAALAALGLPVWAIDARPAACAAARARLGGRPGEAVVLQGPPARRLADLQGRLPRRCLYALSWAAGEPPPRDELFWVPRGEGLVAVQIPPGHDAYGAVQDQLLRWSPDHAVETVVGDDGTAWLLARPQPRVHVTFLIEKYTHEYGKSGLSINLDNLVATLDQTGLASWNVVHYDECHHEGRPIPLAAIGKPAAADVHLLVCVLHYHSRANPTPALLREAKATGSKVVYVWLDKKISQGTPEYYGIADLNVVLDGNDFELPNAWPIFTPKNPRHFHDAGLVRDLDVVLVGEVRYLAQRRAMVDRLRDETRIRVEIVPTSAADPSRALAVADYARLYQRARIGLAMTKDAVRQLKGRVFEIAHCGAMLLCDVNHHVGHYFAAGRDCVVYRDYEDLVQKARYYLDHEAERQAIAQSGHRRCVRDYSHQVFWQSLLGRLGGTAASFGPPSPPERNA